MRTQKTYTVTREIDAVEINHNGQLLYLDAVYEWYVTAYYQEGNQYGYPEDWTPDEDGYTVWSHGPTRWSVNADGEPVTISATELDAFSAMAITAIKDAAWEMERDAIWEDWDKN